MPTVDLGNVPDAQEFPVIPTGKYPCRVVGVEAAISKVDEETGKGGNEMWKLTLEILNGEYAGQKIFDNLTWTPNAFPRVKCFFRAVGRDVDKKEAVSYVEEMAMGASVWVSVTTKPRTYNDVTTDRSKVDFAGYAPVSEGDVTTTFPTDGPGAVPKADTSVKEAVEDPPF